MSLGDYLRYLRAKHGGESTLDIAEAIGLDSPWPINEVEQRYRASADDELIKRLADYYQVPIEDLQWRRQRSRKELGLFVSEAQERNQKIALILRTQERLEGFVLEHGMGTILFQPTDTDVAIVVQRHIVDDWELA
jgi:transcriptional regulator with XRE-family HTH domain